MCNLSKIGLTVAFCILVSGLYSQTKPFNYRVSDSLIILNSNNIPYSKVMSGGFQSPQFSVCDVNGDSKKDLIAYDRVDGSITTFINKGAFGEVKYEVDNRYSAYFPKMEPNKWFLMRDFNNDGYEDIFTTAGNLVTVYKNISYTVTGKPAFDKLPQLFYRNQYPNGSWIEYNALSLPFIHVPGIYDLDFDGDLDILSYSTSGGAIEMYKNLQIEKGLPSDSLSYMLVDLCWGEFTDKDCNTFTLNTCNDTNLFKFYWKRHTNGSSIVLFDADNDKDVDMVLGNEGCDHMTILYNGKKNYNSIYDTIISYDTNFVSASNRAKVILYPSGYFIDINNDGKRDFVMSPNSNSYNIQETNQVFWFQNNGADLAPVFGQKQVLFDNEVFDIGNKSSWACADLDNDGDIDCLCANNADSAYKNGSMDRIYLYENTGNSKTAIFKLRDKDFGKFLSQNISSLTIALADMNADGKLDLVTGNDRGEIKYYKNSSSTNTTLSPTFVLSNNAFPGFNIDVGFYSYPSVADIDNDGLKDLVIGHSDTFLKYYQNIGTAAVPDFIFITAFFGQASPKDSVGFDYIYAFHYDTFGGVVYDSIIGINVNYDKYLFSSPQIANIDGKGNLELLVGNRAGHLKLYSINGSDVNSKFVQYPDFYYFQLLQSQKITSFDLGNRISPVFANIADDEVPEIIIAINRGGLNYLRPNFKYQSGITSTLIPELIPIYPNPAQNYTIVDIDIESIVSVKLITISGQIYKPPFTQKENSINIQTDALNTGIYFLNIETKNGKIKVARLEILR